MDFLELTLVSSQSLICVRVCLCGSLCNEDNIPAENWAYCGCSYRASLRFHSPSCLVHVKEFQEGPWWIQWTALMRLSGCLHDLQTCRLHHIGKQVPLTMIRINEHLQGTSMPSSPRTGWSGQWCLDQQDISTLWNCSFIESVSLFNTKTCKTLFS